MRRNVALERGTHILRVWCQDHQLLCRVLLREPHGRDSRATVLPNHVERSLTWPKPLHAFRGQVSIVLHHDRDFLTTPFRHRRARVQFQYIQSHFFRGLLWWKRGAQNCECVCQYDERV